MVENGRTLIEAQKANHELATYDPRRLTGVSVYQEIDREFSIGDRFRRFRDLRIRLRHFRHVLWHCSGGTRVLDTAFRLPAARLARS